MSGDFRELFPKLTALSRVVGRVLLVVALVVVILAARCASCAAISGLAH